MGVEVAGWFWVTSAPFFRPLFPILVLVLLFGWGGLGGYERHIHVASMPKMLVLTALLPFCTTYFRKDLEQDSVSQASMPVATMPKTLAFLHFAFLHNIRSQGCRTRLGVTSHKHPCLWRPCPKHCYLLHFAFLYNILCKDVEQDTLSHAYKAVAGL